MGHTHIDMFCLYVEHANLLLVDRIFGREAASAREYEEIAEREELELVRYDGSVDGAWYPLNALAIGRHVLIDEQATTLRSLLEDRNVPVLTARMPQHEYPAGKIRCQTNLYDTARPEALEELLA